MGDPPRLRARLHRLRHHDSGARARHRARRTWPNLHHEHVLDCLDAGVRAILCEKSLATTGAEALEIWTAARETDALVVEGFMYRHHPAVRRMDELLANAAIGEVDSVHAAFSLFLPVAWRIDHPTEVIAAHSVGWGRFETERSPVRAVDAFRLRLEAFAAAASGEGPPVPTLAESVVTACTPDALLTSSASGVGVGVAVPEVVRT